jgi:hypothetical protein
MGAAVVGRDDLEVVDVSAPVPILVLDTDVWKLDVFVFVWQPMRQCPLANLVGRAIRPAVAVTLLAIALLKEALVLALQLVVENHPTDLATPLPDFVSGPFVRSVKMRVMRDLWSPREAGVEALPVVERAVLRRIQEVTTTFRQRYERRPRRSSTKGTGFDQARAPQVLKLLVSASAFSRCDRLEVASRHRAKCADRGQDPNVSPGEFIGALTNGDPLSATAARQGEAPREDITRVPRHRLPRIGTAAATAVDVARF